MPLPKTAQESWQDTWKHIVSAYKRHLAGRLIYYEYPADLPKADRSSQPRSVQHSGNNPNQVFIGHLTFEMSPERIRYMLHMASQGAVRATGIIPLRRGCCLATFSTEQEAQRARSLEGYIVCDYDGFWVAENEEQRIYMNTLSTTVRFPCLPRGWVTFEAPRRMAVPTPPSTNSDSSSLSRSLSGVYRREESDAGASVE